jgi:hypothetical protein
MRTSHKIKSEFCFLAKGTQEVDAAEMGRGLCEEKVRELRERKWSKVFIFLIRGCRIFCENKHTVAGHLQPVGHGKTGILRKRLF